MARRIFVGVSFVFLALILAVALFAFYIYISQTKQDNDAIKAGSAMVPEVETFYTQHKSEIHKLVALLSETEADCRLQYYPETGGVSLQAQELEYSVRKQLIDIIKSDYTDIISGTTYIRVHNKYAELYFTTNEWHIVKIVHSQFGAPYVWYKNGICNELDNGWYLVVNITQRI